MAFFLAQMKALKQFYNMRNYILFFTGFFLLYSLNAFSQEEWTLERCIQYAIENNLDVKQSGIQNEINIVSLNQSKRNLLPSASIDRFFICDTWHHVENKTQYLSQMKKMLKPGGQVIIVDYFKKELPTGPPPSMKIARDDVVRQMKSGGFTLSREFTFLPYQYFLIFTPQ